MTVYSNGTSHMSLQLDYVYGDSYELPEGAFLRLTKVDDAEGNYGEAPILCIGSAQDAFSVEADFDRAFGKSEYMTFTAYTADGAELFGLKLVLDYYTMTSNTWPEPESTPALPTLPPATSTAAPSPTPQPTPSGTPVVQASYEVAESFSYTHRGATLEVYGNDLSVLTLYFRTSKTLPDGAFFRLTKVDGVEGNYGEGLIGPALVEEGEKNLLGATLLIDRALGKSDRLVVLCCAADGSEFMRISFTLDKYTSEDGLWPEPESTPALPTIPPIQPTPSPTPRPTLAPDATEPPQDSALYSVSYKASEYREGYTHKDCKLRIYSDNLSVMTMRFTYEKDIPDGTVARIVRVDGVAGSYAEATVTRLEDGMVQCAFYFNQAVGNMEHFTVDLITPDGTRLLHLFYYLSQSVYPPTEWYELPALPTPTPNLAAATEPPYNTALVKQTYDLEQRVSNYSHYNVTLRQYADFSTLNVFFYYTADLPEDAYMRVVAVDGVEGDYGSAVIGPANVEGTSASLLNAKIFSLGLPSCSTLTVECCYPEGEPIFRLDFKLKETYYPSGSNSTSYATATPVPPGYGYDYWDSLFGPSPTPWYPTYDTWWDWYGSYYTW